MSDTGKNITPRIVHVAINTPVADGFDYLATDCLHAKLIPGVRLRVPFGHRQTTAVLLEHRSQTLIATHKLKHVELILDDAPILPPELLELAHWVSQYYHHPLGEVIHTMLPTALRQGQSNTHRQESIWLVNEEHSPSDLGRAPKQQQLYQALAASPEGLSTAYFAENFQNWRPALKALEDKGLVKNRLIDPATPIKTISTTKLTLNPDQHRVLEQIGKNINKFHACLLDGVTGSGKTEIYIRLIEQMLQLNRQTLVLVPEIGLTPQLLGRFNSRLAAEIYVLHSGMTDLQRLHVWQAAQSGHARVIIGTRSAIFLPLQALGLIIVDEEHDGSLKQQDGLRYHARDLAIVRAQKSNIPVVLGSATPALETLQNANNGRYLHAQLPVRAGSAKLPKMKLIDARITPKGQVLSRSLLDAMHTHLQKYSQVLIFLNRRGFAPTLICYACGWTAECKRCDARMTLHQHDRSLRCHHCGYQQRPATSCPDCAETELTTMGIGTEQVEQVVRLRFPDHSIARIDRDAVRRKGELEMQLAKAQAGEINVLIGTQMLAKGHHFPQVTLVGILGIDQGLFSADFRGPEFMAQLMTQVAGRAGRAEQNGEVLIETHQPDNPLLHLLIGQNYSTFAATALRERQVAGLPPFCNLALVRAEAVQAEQALAFLQIIQQQLTPKPDVQVLGPIPAPMERRAGRYRAQLLLQSKHRTPLRQTLKKLRELAHSLPDRRKVRWSIDVDPTEML